MTGVCERNVKKRNETKRKGKEKRLMKRELACNCHREEIQSSSGGGGTTIISSIGFALHYAVRRSLSFCIIFIESTAYSALQHFNKHHAIASSRFIFLSHTYYYYYSIPIELHYIAGEGCEGMITYILRASAMSSAIV